MTKNQQQIQLARRPQGVPVHDDFRFETIAVPEQAITGGVIAEVLTDGNKLRKGDVVIGNLAWQEYSAVNESALRKLDTDIAPAQAYLGILGMTGLTAYFGLLDIGRPKKGETVVVSGAAAPSAQQSDRLLKSKARVLSVLPDLTKKSRI